MSCRSLTFSEISSHRDYGHQQFALCDSRCFPWFSFSLDMARPPFPSVLTQDAIMSWGTVRVSGLPASPTSGRPTHIPALWPHSLHSLVCHSPSGLVFRAFATQLSYWSFFRPHLGLSTTFMLSGPPQWQDPLDECLLFSSVNYRSQIS